VLKTFGYLVSTLSVVLLGIVSWKSAIETPALMAPLVLGMATAILGMLLRWCAYLIEHRERKRQEGLQPAGGRVKAPAR
jgi:hypothetical protein